MFSVIFFSWEDSSLRFLWLVSLLSCVCLSTISYYLKMNVRKQKILQNIGHSWEKGAGELLFDSFTANTK